MIKAEGATSFPVYRYTAEDTYSYVTDLTGSNGIKGEKGDKGDQGEQGIPGVAGENGVDGITYTPAIGTVTSGADTEAAASVDIDSENKVAKFNFVIPRGKDSVQFIPSINDKHELEWSNNGDLPNPPNMPLQQIYANTPLGTVLSFAGSKAPNGYLLCDGKSYAVADYEDLYAVIGNTYGGDTENFNVPNLVDKFIQGSSTSGTEKEAGLPNITGSFVPWGYQNNLAPSGAFSQSREDASSFNAYGNTTGSQINFDASRSNAIYGNSDTVQPPALTMVYIIKAFHTNEGVDSGVSDDVIDYVESEIAEVESKIATAIVGTKTQYRGSQSIDISTGGKLTLIYSSEYASQAGCYMLLSNFNTEPLLIELGRNNIGQFSVTATHKSNSVDTITVTTAGDIYSWCVLQF